MGGGKGKKDVNAKLTTNFINIMKYKTNHLKTKSTDLFAKSTVSDAKPMITDAKPTITNSHFYKLSQKTDIT
jgi:tRNA (Thr-GGU) A37 N-methylase